MGNLVGPAMPPDHSHPSALRRLWNVAAAAVDFACDGFAIVEEELYQARLAVCASCDRREDAICSECGCYIKPKAAGRTFNCPLGRWDVPDTSLLPERLRVELAHGHLPEQFGHLAGGYLLGLQPAADERAMGHFQALWLAEPAGPGRCLRLWASEQGVTLHFVGTGDVDTALGWRRAAWTIPFLFSGPMPLEPFGAALGAVLVWPAWHPGSGPLGTGPLATGPAMVGENGESGG